MPDELQHDTQPSREDLLARIAELERKTSTSREPYMEVSEKGGISFYNLGQRFPITAYKGQLMSILTLTTGFSEEEILASDWPIVEFIEKNGDRLSSGKVRDVNKLQNTVQADLDESLRKLVHQLRKDNPRMSVAEAETEARQIQMRALGIKK